MDFDKILFMHWYIWSMLWLIQIIFPNITVLWPLIDFRIMFMLNILWNNWWIWSDLVDTLKFFYVKTCTTTKISTVAGYHVVFAMLFYALPPESGGALCYTLRNFECPSVRLSVRPSVSAHHHSCIGNSSYSFRPILLKLYRCFKDGLKICILFFQNPEIIFYHFFPIFNLDIFRAVVLQICIWSMYLVSVTPPTVFGESFWNFTGVLRMVWRYAYCFFRILKLFFITFFAFLT